MTRLETLRSHVDRERGRRDAMLDAVAVDHKKVAHLEGLILRTERAIEVTQAATEARREELKDRVESLVTRGLRAVFEREDFEFAFRVTLRANAFGATPVLRSKFGDRDLEVGIVEGHGGGVADVVSFLLRVVVLSLSRPRLAPIMILDESFRHVSPEYLRGVSVLLRELSTSAGVQFLLVTHKPELLDAADVVYRAELRGGRTEFTLEHATRDESYHQAPRRGQQRLDDTTAFDGDDMVARTPDAESTVSKTADATARRVRSRSAFKRKKGRRNA